MEWAMALELKSFTGARKAAIFLATMGADVSAKIFKGFDDTEIETLSTELSLANLEPDLAASILPGLSDEVRAEVIVRVATIDKTSPEVIRQVEQVLERQVAAGFAAGVTYGEGTKTVAEVLNRVDPATQKGILERLDETSPGLAEQIRTLMFTFEDLIHVDDRGLQRVIQDADQKDLVLSLKAATEDVVAKIFKNMSERTAS